MTERSGGMAIPYTSLLAEAIAILLECEQTWGCECPYCDRDFGNDFESHADDCRLKRFLDTANADGQGCRVSRHTLDHLVGASGSPNPGGEKT